MRAVALISSLIHDHKQLRNEGRVNYANFYAFISSLSKHFNSLLTVTKKFLAYAHNLFASCFSHAQAAINERFVFILFVFKDFNIYA